MKYEIWNILLLSHTLRIHTHWWHTLGGVPTLFQRATIPKIHYFFFFFFFFNILFTCMALLHLPLDPRTRIQIYTSYNFTYMFLHIYTRYQSTIPIVQHSKCQLFRTSTIPKVHFSEVLLYWSFAFLKWIGLGLGMADLQNNGRTYFE